MCRSASAVFGDIGQAVREELRVFLDSVAPSIRFNFGRFHSDMVGDFAI